ncbi:hypothetical protein BYT27DRAFT_7243465 [Phlegmacium glaucopus]|nr:hypothetical protein BYT27DRAFT_7243465 [Phlegmacium glaucopus]
MPFVPLPTADVCDLASPSSLKIAQTVSRTWYNLDPSLWSIIPERITFHADGKGEFSSPFTIYSKDVQESKVLSCKFTWKLARDGIFSGFEEMDEDALFYTIPRLIRSEEAWSRKTWMGGRVPAYLRLDQDGTIALEPDSLISDQFIPDSPDGMLLPPELLETIFLIASEEEIAAKKLTMTCRRSREIVMKRRRKDFTILTKRFITNGIALYIECGHFDPVPDSSKPPTSFYCFEARMLKHPPGCGYTDLEDNWGLGWNVKERIYHSCELPLPDRKTPPLWRRLHGDGEYFAHPEVKKTWT